VRWPLSRVITNAQPLSADAVSLVQSHTNVRSVLFEQPAVSYVFAPNFRVLGKRFGVRTHEFATAISQGDFSDEFKASGSITVLGEVIDKDCVEITATAPEGFSLASDGSLIALLDTAQSDELLGEGFFRELVRRVQQLRKDADMQKHDRVVLVFSEEMKDIVLGREDELMRVTGASKVVFGNPQSAVHTASHVVSSRTLSLGLYLANK